MTQVKISEWFNDRPVWLRDVAKRLLEGDSLRDEDFSDLVTLCKQEGLGLSVGTAYVLPANAFDSTDSKKIKLTSIGNIEGINALAPKIPLSFGVGNLAVVYGQNGAGKSGYVRLLKHACGVRNPGTLHPNVYSKKQTNQKCSIGYEKNDVLLNETWEASTGFLPALKSVDIFDTSCGTVYVTAENEVTYEPPALSFLSELISVCEEISTRLGIEIENIPSKKPTLPTEFLNTTGGKWYGKISARTKEAAIIKSSLWTDGEEVKVAELQKRLSEKDPLKRAEKIRQQQVHIQQIIQVTEKNVVQLSDERCKELLASKTEATVAGKSAEVAATTVFTDAPLKGVGSDVWKQLWEQARKYSQESAYIDRDYPHVEGDTRCVLCHQPFSEEAKTRMASFEEFVKGAAQNKADKAQAKVATLLKGISEISTHEHLTTKLEAAGIAGDKESSILLAAYNELRIRKELLEKVDRLEDLPKLPQCKKWIDKARNQISTYEKAAQKYEDDSKTDNRSGLKVQLNELLVKKWLSQQRKPIDEEIARLEKIQILKAAKKLTNTRALSTKKGELAEILITDAFVRRFNKELENLGAKHVEIELIKSKITKGKVLHRLRLIGAKVQSPEDVLSEGEYRIVSLAAFLADVTGKYYSAPFVFDDPISSLDQSFEEAVVQRLVALSKERQVIVLTHRLSLLGLIQDYAKKASVVPEIICIRKESWGTGEPGGTPLFAKRPDKALNALINESLPKACKILDKHGQEGYDPIAKSLCSNFRILVERMVESHLLADVVQRYRRAINTVGKIEKLAKISDLDCRLIDDMMTKYSRYEHSQPLEAPITVPLPAELEADFKKLQSWHGEFKSRPVIPPV